MADRVTQVAIEAVTASDKMRETQVVMEVATLAVQVRETQVVMEVATLYTAPSAGKAQIVWVK